MQTQARQTVPQRLCEGFDKLILNGRCGLKALDVVAPSRPPPQHRHLTAATAAASPPHRRHRHRLIAAISAAASPARPRALLCIGGVWRRLAVPGTGAPGILRVCPWWYGPGGVGESGPAAVRRCFASWVGRRWRVQWARSRSLLACRRQSGSCRKAAAALRNRCTIGGFTRLHAASHGFMRLHAQPAARASSTATPAHPRRSGRRSR